MKAVQRLAHVSFPSRGSPGKGNGFLANLKNLQSNGDAPNEAPKKLDQTDVNENGTHKEEATDVKPVTDNSAEEDINKVESNMKKITINGSVVSA